ncbi:MAG: PAS domain S-box protein [Planctomycetes bacterium]|nr:PAS domain S-box protein [Planctomycetota bacterium]
MQYPVGVRSAWWKPCRLAGWIGRRPEPEGRVEAGHSTAQMAPSMTRVLLLVLGVVFVAESGIMLWLPWLVPHYASKPVRAVVDASLLTLVVAPIVWYVIIGPLRRVALSERAKVASIVQTAVDAIVTFGEDRRVQSFNPAAERLFGCPGSQAVGEPVERFLPSIPDECCGAGRVMETTARRWDGNEFPALVSLSRIDLNDGPLCTAILHDLTELKRAEAERLAAAREKEAVRAQQMALLAQVATGVAHEIRNPLTAVKMLVQAHREDAGESGALAHDLQLVEQEIRRMERTLKTFLEFARPSRSRHEPVSLNSVVYRTIALIEGRARQQDVSIHSRLPGCDVRLLGDWERLQQLLLNLTLNSLDVMPDGGELEIALRQTDDEIVLRVQDTGPGFSEEVLKRMFEPFFTTKETGVGLGLGICKRIVEQHGGTLTAENVPEGGGRMLVRFPRAAAGLPEGKTPLPIPFE